MKESYGTPLLITEHTHRKLDDRAAYAMRPIGHVRVKGKDDPGTIHEAINGDLSEN